MKHKLLTMIAVLVLLSGCASAPADPVTETVTDPFLVSTEAVTTAPAETAPVTSSAKGESTTEETGKAVISTEAPKESDPITATASPTEPVQTSEPAIRPTEPAKPAEAPKPTESAPTDAPKSTEAPRLTEPKPTELPAPSAPTETPTEPPAEAPQQYDLAAVIAYANSYAQATYGFIPDSSLTVNNASHYPGFYGAVNEEQWLKELAVEEIDYSYECMVALGYDLTGMHCNFHASYDMASGQYYLVFLYG